MNVIRKIAILLFMPLMYVVGCGQVDPPQRSLIQNSNYLAPLTISSSAPQNGAIGIDPSHPFIQVFFSQEIDIGSLWGNVFIQRRRQATLQETTPINIFTNGNTLNVQLEFYELMPDTTYTVVFLPGLRSISGHYLNNNGNAQLRLENSVTFSTFQRYYFY